MRRPVVSVDLHTLYCKSAIAKSYPQKTRRGASTQVLTLSWGQVPDPMVDVLLLEGDG